MTVSPNQPALQPRPACTNNESAPTSISPPCVPSRSPQPHLLPAETSTKSAKFESQLMTAASSSSSMPSDQQANTSMDTTGASPYGTRSRNRTGISRPNYAEDREELEYDWGSARKSQARSGSAIPNNLQLGEIYKSLTANTRRSSTTAPYIPVLNNKAAMTNGQRDLPGMSSFSVNPEASAVPPAPSRKRKAPGNGPVTSQAPSVMTQAPSSGTSRRTGPPINTKPSRTTNLMTFDNCQGYLRNGKLKADDGTVLSVNGMFRITVRLFQWPQHGV